MNQLRCARPINGRLVRHEQQCGCLPHAIVDVFETIGPQVDSAVPPAHNHHDVSTVHDLRARHEKPCLAHGSILGSPAAKRDVAVLHLHQMGHSRARAMLAVFIMILQEGVLFREIYPVDEHVVCGPGNLAVEQQLVHHLLHLVRVMNGCCETLKRALAVGEGLPSVYLWRLDVWQSRVQAGRRASAPRQRAARGTIHPPEVATPQA